MLTNLRAARLAAGLTTEAAGQIIGKSQSVYSKIERRQTGNGVAPGPGRPASHRLTRP